MEQTGSLYFDSDVDVKKLYASIDQIDRNIRNMTNNFEKSGTVMDSMFSKLTTAAGAYLSLNFMGHIGSQIIQVTGEFQQLGIAFEVMLGSKEKADKLMAEQIAFSQKTPYTLTDVASNTKQLMAMGVAYEDVMATMKSLGDVAAGVSVPISRVAINYGQVMTLGKLQEREVRDFAMAGIPVIEELAKNLNKTKAEIMDMISASQIAASDVTKAFQTMSGEGGKFYNMMEKQNASVTGQISNLQDKIQVMMNSIGSANSGLIYSGISGLTSLVTNYEQVLKVLELLVITYGSYKAAVMLATVAEKIRTTYGVYDIATKNLQVAATIRATVAQSSLNAAIMKNPYAIALAGVMALISYLVIFSDKTDKAAGVSAEFNKNLSETTDEIKKSFKAITDTKNGTDAHAKAIQAVNDKYKDYLPNLLTEKSSLEDVKKAQDAVTESMAKSLAFKAQGDQLKDLKTNVDTQLTDFYLQIDKASKKLDDVQKGQFKALIDQYKEQVAANFRATGSFPALGPSIMSIFDKVSGKSLGGLQTTKLEMDIKELIRSEVDLDTKTKGLKTTYESYLEALGLTGKGTGVASDSLKTVQQQITDTKTAIVDAKKKLDEFRAPGSTATETDIKDQEDAIKTLEQTLETLTGVKKKQKEAVDELKLAEEALEKAVKSGNQAAITAAATRVNQLENEKRLLQETIDLELQKAWRRQFDGQPMSEITTIGTKPILQVGQRKQELQYSTATNKYEKVTLEVTAIDKTGPVWKKVQLEGKKLQKGIDDGIKKAADSQKDVDKDKEESDRKKLDTQKQLIDGAYELTNQYIDQLGLTEDQAAEMKTIVAVAANLASGDYIGAAVSFMSQMISVLGNGKKAEAEAEAQFLENQKKRNEYLAEMIDLQVKFNLIQNDQIRNQPNSNVFIESYSDKIKNAATALDDSKKKYLSFINSMRTATFNPNFFLYTTDNKGQVAGLTDAGIKKNTELALGKIKVVDELSSAGFTKTTGLLDKYPLLIDAAGNFNSELAKSILSIGSIWEGSDAASQKILTPQNKADLQAIVDYTDQIKANQDAINSAIESIAGSISSDLYSALTSAWDAGTDSFTAFKESVTKGLKEIVKQMLFNAVFSDSFSKLQAGFTKSFSAGGDGSVVDDMTTFLNSAPGLLKTWNDGMKGIDKQLAAAGFNASSSTSSPTTAVTGIAAGATEETVSAMVGQTMAMRLDLKSIDINIKGLEDIGLRQVNIAQLTVGHLAQIERNTSHNARLVTIESELKDMNATLKKGLF